MKILVADHSASNRELLGEYISELGHKPIYADNGSQAVEMFGKEGPDLVIVGINMPKMDGYEVAVAIRQSCYNFSQWVPIFLLCERVDDECIAKGIESGADDYLIKPISPVFLKAKIKAIRRLVTLRENLMDYGKQLQDVNYKLQSTNQLLSELSLKDPLTRLGNRRAFEETLLRSCRTSSRVGKPLSLLMIDVDFFKKFNDTYGHQAGDICLQQVAQCIEQQLHRASDFAARYGGEEFAVVLPHTPNDGALFVAAQIQTRIADLTIKHEASDAGIVTASIGVATSNLSEDVTPESIVAAADAALYVAKENGRNRVENSVDSDKSADGQRRDAS